MANPYHNETGKFCSRDKMLNSIHQLAASGKTTEYLALKKDFDEIDKGNIVVSKDLLQALLQKATLSVNADITHPEEIISELQKEEEVTPNLYSSLDSHALGEIIEDLGWKTEKGEGDFKQEILKIVKDSEYDENVVYSAVYANGLDYEQKAQLVNEHDPALYSILIKKYPQEVLTKDKENFVKAVKDLSSKSDRNSTDNYQLSEMVDGLAKNAENTEDLKLAVDSAPYGYYGGHSTVNIASSKHLNKEIALAVLDREITASKENYWGVRHAMTRNLASRGYLMIPVPEFTENVFPVKGSAPAALVDNANKVSTSISEDDRSRYAKNDELQEAYAKADIYEDRFNALKVEYKKNGSRITTPEAAEVKLRFQNAVSYLNQISDHGRIAKHINALRL